MQGAGRLHIFAKRRAFAGANTCRALNLTCRTLTRSSGVASEGVENDSQGPPHGRRGIKKSPLSARRVAGAGGGDGALIPGVASPAPAGDCHAFSLGKGLRV